MMKTLLVTLLLAGLVMSGSALQCYSCLPPRGKPCMATIENCPPDKNACFHGERNNPVFVQKKCMHMEECVDIKESRAMQVHCCQTDLCNK